MTVREMAAWLLAFPEQDAIVQVPDVTTDKVYVGDDHWALLDVPEWSAFDVDRHSERGFWSGDGRVGLRLGHIER